MPGRNKTIGIGLGIIGGIIAGAAIGLLYAPKRGAETRKIVQDRATEYGNQARDTLSRAAGAAAERLKPLTGDTGVSQEANTDTLTATPSPGGGGTRGTQVPATRPAEIQTEEAAHPRSRSGRRPRSQAPQNSAVNTRMSSDVAPNKNVNGDTVSDSSGKEIGKLEGVMLDNQSGEIIYGVIGFNDSANPEELCAVPWPALKQKGENEWTLEIPQPSREQALIFTRDTMPDESALDDIDAQYDQYGYTHYWQKKREGKHVPVQDLD